jgi:hypothetical protein
MSSEWICVAGMVLSLATACSAFALCAWVMRKA